MNAIGNYPQINPSQVSPQTSFYIRFQCYKLKQLVKKVPPFSPDLSQNASSRIVMDLTPYFSSSLTIEYSRRSKRKFLTFIDKSTVTCYPLDRVKDYKVRFLLSKISRRSIRLPIHWKLSGYFNQRHNPHRIQIFLQQFSKSELRQVASLNLSYSNLLSCEVKGLTDKLPNLRKLVLRGCTEIDWKNFLLPKRVQKLDISETSICAKQMARIYRSFNERSNRLAVDLITDNCPKIPPLISALTRYALAYQINPLLPNLSFLKNPPFNHPAFLSTFFKNILSYSNMHKKTVFYFKGFSLPPDLEKELEKAKKSNRLKKFILA
ncbi:hypothetical protein [Parachlamydia sp. AcF125]|uniref:hypothetical protein n=1 Tax=Parachlamydia sp. AcF125 TaxID=2795736 RepID=UPI001BC9D0CB|nr:hypothetical protein [Parachlamydia sp. AcF125]MBS4168403.1 hypothetical protein [Parachlamydia sp. AcF125]